jgi:hypothetical protein
VFTVNFTGAFPPQSVCCNIGCFQPISTTETRGKQPILCTSDEIQESQSTAAPEITAVHIDPVIFLFFLIIVEVHIQLQFYLDGTGKRHQFTLYFEN